MKVTAYRLMLILGFITVAATIYAQFGWLGGSLFGIVAMAGLGALERRYHSPERRQQLRAKLYPGIQGGD